MEKRNIIVIGASAGGFEAIKQLVTDLPANLDASVFIVWHMSPDVRGILPQVLNKQQKLYAAHGQDKELIKPGRIYVAPPDHHLLIEHGLVRVTRGPKENRFRPAVDPLFRSAALAYGARVIGVILSGALDDGSAGLWTIKQQGGMAVVQHPYDAEVPSMPESAIKAVTADYVVPVREMGNVLVKLVNEEVVEHNDNGKGQQIRTEIEVGVAMEDKGLQQNILQYGELSPYTCPECHGVLAALKEGDRVRFRCHTGHAYSADSLLADLTENIEDSLWTAIRSIQESVMLLNHMGDHLAEVNQPRLAAMYFKKAKEAENRANTVRQAVMDHEQLSADSIQQETQEITDGTSQHNG
jgi:two-component system chemotaxis response regulator CheB